MGKGRKAGGRRGRKCGYGHLSAKTNVYLLETVLESQPELLARPVHVPAMWLRFRRPVTLLGPPVVQGSDRWDPVQGNLFPQGTGALCKCLLTYQQLEHASHSSSIISRRYLIDKDVPLGRAARSQFRAAHNQTLFPFPVTSTFLARPGHWRGTPFPPKIN